MATVTPFLALSIFTAILGMFQFGFNTGVVNAPEAAIKQFINDTYMGRYPEEKIEESKLVLIFSLAVNAFVIGGMIGGLSGGWLAEKVGRKNGLLYSQALSLTGAILSGCSKPAEAYEMIIVGRLLIGIACGLFTGLVPLYITEVAPLSIRGGMGIFNQLAVTSGIFMGQILGLNGVMGSDDYWPILVSFTAFPSALQTILLFALPESPRYLILEKNDESAGTQALKKLRNTDDIDEELDDIKAEANASSNTTSLSIWQLLRTPNLRLALFVTICMHLSQQLSGINAIFYYSTKFFTDAGISSDNAQYATLGVGAIMVTMSIVTIPFMDKLGRRTLHFAGMIGMIICSILITIALNMGTEEKPADPGDDNATTSGSGIFTVIAALSLVTFFALGPGSIPWLITGELFTQAPRSAAISVATLVNWSGNLAVGLIFPVMQKEIKDFSFLPFTVSLVILFLVLFFYLPETKGRSVNEIEALFQIPNAWRKPIGRSNELLLAEINNKQDAGHVNYGTTEQSKQ